MLKYALNNYVMSLYTTTFSELFLMLLAKNTANRFCAVITGFETGNKYKIKNNQDQAIYDAIEDSDCCTRNICGPIRPFGMKILDAHKNEIMHLNRPLACDSCLCPCWEQVGNMGLIVYSSICLQ